MNNTLEEQGKLSAEGDLIVGAINGDPVVLRYVGGAYPYVWIGTHRGNYFGSVDMADLRAYLKGKRS